jgi:hypothetical protein
MSCRVLEHSPFLLKSQLMTQLKPKGSFTLANKIFLDSAIQILGKPKTLRNTRFNGDKGSSAKDFWVSLQCSARVEYTAIKTCGSLRKGI